MSGPGFCFSLKAATVTKEIMPHLTFLTNERRKLINLHSSPPIQMKALVVDDDDLIRSNVAEVLSNDGWEVHEAGSAEQALELLHRDTWSLVFCDVRLSAKNNHEGYDVLRSFTEEQPEAQIVLMTGHGSAVGALDAVSSGAYDYLMKPFEIEDVKRISQAVRRGIDKRSRRSVSDELPSPLVYTSDIDLVGVSAAF